MKMPFCWILILILCASAALDTTVCASEARTTIVGAILATVPDEDNDRVLVQLSDGIYPLAQDAQIIDNNGRVASIEGFTLPHHCRITVQAEEEGLQRIVRIRPLHR